MILIPGAPLLSIALNANVLATVLLPVSLVFVLMLANDRTLMGRWANRRSTNAFGIVVIVFVEHLRCRLRHRLLPADRPSDRRAMSREAPPTPGGLAREAPPTRAESGHHDDEELVMYLERDQLVSATTLPVPLAKLGQRAIVGLWLLRLFVILRQRDGHLHLHRAPALRPRWRLRPVARRLSRAAGADREDADGDDQRAQRLRRQPASVARADLRAHDRGHRDDRRGAPLDVCGEHEVDAGDAVGEPGEHVL